MCVYIYIYIYKNKVNLIVSYTNAIPVTVSGVTVIAGKIHMGEWFDEVFTHANITPPILLH